MLQFFVLFNTLVNVDPYFWGRDGETRSDRMRWWPFSVLCQKDRWFETSFLLNPGPLPWRGKVTVRRKSKKRKEWTSVLKNRWLRKGKKEMKRGQQHLQVLFTRCWKRKEEVERKKEVKKRRRKGKDGSETVNREDGTFSSSCRYFRIFSFQYRARRLVQEHLTTASR